MLGTPMGEDEVERGKVLKCRITISRLYKMFLMKHYPEIVVET